MVKIVTPVSELFRINTIAKSIASKSFCLEGRECSPKHNAEKEYLFHFDKNIISPWNEHEKRFVLFIIKSNKRLKLLTFHMSAACSRPILKDNMFYIGGKRFSRRNMLDNAKNNIIWLKKHINNEKVKIAVENNNYYPTAAYRYITDPNFISDIVNRNNIFFLLDIAHARITAFNRKNSYNGYLRGLPLNKMIQLHVSKEDYMGEGLAYDAHRLPDKEILSEAKKLIKKFHPEYITIEYYNDENKLINILERCRKLYS